MRCLVYNLKKLIEKVHEMRKKPFVSTVFLFAMLAIPTFLVSQIKEVPATLETGAINEIVSDGFGINRGNGTSSPREMKRADKTGFVDVGDTRLFYQKIGKGDQVLVVPLHLYLFEDFKHLAKNRTIIFYDVRNRGASDRVEDVSKLNIHEDIEDLEKLRKHFGIKKMSLIGESYVGLMVVMYAMKYPQYVDKLIQIGPVPLKFGTKYPAELTANDPSPVPDPEKEAELEKLREKDFHKTNPKEFCERDWAVVATMLVGKPELAPKVKSPCVHPNEWPEALERHFEYHFVSVQKLDIPKSEVEKVKHPVLTIHGTKDRNAPYGSGKEWSEILPNATLLTVKGAAHVPWIDEPEIVFGAIEKFLSEKDKP